jgi:hypothetical protein
MITADHSIQERMRKLKRPVSTNGNSFRLVVNRNVRNFGRKTTSRSYRYRRRVGCYHLQLEGIGGTQRPGS